MTSARCSNVFGESNVKRRLVREKADNKKEKKHKKQEELTVARVKVEK